MLLPCYAAACRHPEKYHVMVLPGVVRKALQYVSCTIYWLGCCKASPVSNLGFCIGSCAQCDICNIPVTCCADVMRVLQDTKLMQLQTNALDAVTDILKALPQGTDLSNQQAIREQLTSITTDNRSSAIKSQAQTALTLLPAQGNDRDAA